MRRVTLMRTRDLNTWVIVSEKGVKLVEKRIEEEQEAIDWAKNYMSSFSGINCYLEIDYGSYGKRTYEEESKETPSN